jgi:hypothetical protein
MDKHLDESGDGVVKITVKHSTYLNRSWPSINMAIILLVVAGNMLSYPLWWLLFSKYQRERDSMFGENNESLFVTILDVLARGVLEALPTFVSVCFLLYTGLCAGYVGISMFDERSESGD